MTSQWEKLKRIKDDLGAIQESDLALALKIKRIVSKRPGIPSKVSNPRTRSDLLDDREILKRINGSIRKRNSVALTAGPTRVVKEEATPSPINPEDDSSTGKVEKVHVRHWDHSSQIMKSLAYGAAIPSSRRHAMTIRIRPDIIDHALRSPKGFVGYMQDRITRFMKKALGPTLPVPDFMIAVEGVPLEDFHLHGAIDLPVDAKLVETIKRALLEASGDVTGPARARKVHFKRIDQVAGWFAYIGKARLSTEESLKIDRQRRGIPPLPKKEGLVGANLALRRAGKDWFQAARRTEAPLLRFEPRA
ncbi:MAG: hypothetical protein Q8Q88_01065 [Phenylobacterium sp.]|uniref:hypothetical protein n=1 Tax=Phenylobacterium sp. TaxID=1871053 RepID=UPI002732BE7F|nr:hypothetical protein [Phenylobacterium sp.]MDP3745615.1 hypothetical protein [Phenylobacterium sp.]